MMAKGRKAKKTITKVERDLIAGLKGFHADLKTLKSGDDICKKYTVRRVVLELEPSTYSAKQVQAVRQMLNVSQCIFAQFLGVSIKAVQKWESGSVPSVMACRFMDEIRRAPEYWQNRLRQSMKEVAISR